MAKTNRLRELRLAKEAKSVRLQPYGCASQPAKETASRQEERIPAPWPW